MAENNDVDLNLGAAVLQYMLESNNELDIPMSLDTNSTLYRAGNSDVNAGAEQLVADQQDLSATLTAEQMDALADFASNADMVPADELAEIQAQLVQVDRDPDGAMISGEKTSPDFKAGFGDDVQVQSSLEDGNAPALDAVDKLGAIQNDILMLDDMDPAQVKAIQDLIAQAATGTDPDISIPSDDFLTGKTPLDNQDGISIPIEDIQQAIQDDGWQPITGTGDDVFASTMDANDGSWQPVGGDDPQIVLESTVALEQP